MASCKSCNSNIPFKIKPVWKRSALPIELYECIKCKTTLVETAGSRLLLLLLHGGTLVFAWIELFRILWHLPLPIERLINNLWGIIFLFVGTMLLLVIYSIIIISIVDWIAWHFIIKLKPLDVSRRNI